MLTLPPSLLTLPPPQIHKQNSYTTEVRTEALASDAVRIIDLALNNLPYPSERAAEQAISAFLTISL